MNVQFERRILGQLTKILNNEERQLRLLRTLRALCYVLSWITVFGIAFLAKRPGVPVAALPIAGIIAGFLGGIGLYFSMSLRQWPVIKPHISRDSISRRLKEIE